ISMTHNSTVISPSAEMLLTSVGPTTEAMHDRLHEMKRFSGPGTLRVLRIADGWQPLTAAHGASYLERIEQRVEAVTARIWSDRYIEYVLGKVSVETMAIGQLDPDGFAETAKRFGMLLAPGGNTYLTALGLQSHRE